MEYLIPIIIAYVVYRYNYRRYVKPINKIIFDLKNEIMSATDSDKIDALTTVLNKFQIIVERRLTAMETKVNFIFGGSSLVSMILFGLSIYLNK